MQHRHQLRRDGFKDYLPTTPHLSAEPVNALLSNQESRRKVIPNVQDVYTVTHTRNSALLMERDTSTGEHEPRLLAAEARFFLLPAELPEP